MYLKNIKLNGFKSFADKTTITFNNDITAIVGPNGSGKSNIVDAIRWVLGEQSVRSLRASTSMSDVIFSGSKTREELKKASVSLTFDNSDNYLNTEFEEVEIKRVVYKTGENEYFINATKVRLKDIHELFLDKGAGQNAFNIISQGNIVDIVNYKPLERRVLFESAAGVLKYKKRKEEANRKLERTKQNISSLKLVLDELAITIGPLKRQSEDAKKYLEIKDDLESTEISLITYDIEQLNNKYSDLKIELENLNDLLNSANNIIKLKDIEALKLENLKIEDEINNLNSKVILINKNKAVLTSDKIILEERSKYNENKTITNDNIIALRKEESELKKELNVLEHEITTLVSKYNSIVSDISNFEDKILNLKIKRTNLNSALEQNSKNILMFKNKIEILENNLENNVFLPKAVKSILENHRFSGVHNVIGKLIDVPIKYSKSIEIALGFASNFIVVNNFDVAKECISYLKEYNLGRATFFPLDTIKSRYVDVNIDDEDYYGIASDLVSFDLKYKNIVENQLGNVLIVKDLNSIKRISKNTNYKYKLVSLDGDISFPGGSVTGGREELSRNYNNDLKLAKEELKEKEINEAKLIKDYEAIDKEYISLNNQKEDLDVNSFKLGELLSLKRNTHKNLKEDYDNILKNINNLDNIINNKVEEELIKIINLISKDETELEITENLLDDLKNKKDSHIEKINSLEREYKEKVTEDNKINNKIKETEIEISKLEIKLDNLLVSLGEDYNLTYEAAREQCLELGDINLAREKATKLKKIFKTLKDINIGSIKEYERLNTRYEFLSNQKEDLLKSSQELENIIIEMDEIMIDKFRESFKKIKEEYKKVFKEIFNGGKADLYLTDPNDILTTGVEMVAIPPGKKLTSTIALSGGEKALAAISLLFAILNSKPVPFIVLDEAEAALDEANVELFGKYINKKQKESQFILITHKKKMMEYVDVLYGVTMQESGVSKLVGTKLTK